MTEYEASRTLVKSPPELWAELSDVASLSGHLAEPFGEIRITRLEPETAVAWEGERASGTVRIEPSGWGTRVTLTARAVGADPPAQRAHRNPDPPAPSEQRGLRGLLHGLLGRSHAPSEPDTFAPAPGAPRDAPTSTVDPEVVLAAVLDKLGAAHHRPFSRA